MGKNKLAKFAEMKTFPNVFQPSLSEILHKDFPLKGKWNEQYFKNDYPIVLELGCGKGEYTIALAEKYKEKNFIGIDIKGARIWKGAKYAYQNQLKNAIFLRTRIELIKSFFAQNEVDEIWITFPDPQLKKRRNKKRLTSSRFLSLYQQFIKENAFIHLKTDNEVLYEYTCNLVKLNQFNILVSTNDLYGSNLEDDILDVKTHYEKLFLDEGLTIKYLKFQLECGVIKDLPEDDINEEE